MGSCPPLAVSAYRPWNSREVCLLACLALHPFRLQGTSRQLFIFTVPSSPWDLTTLSGLFSGVAWAWLFKLRMFSLILRLRLSCESVHDRWRPS